MDMNCPDQIKQWMEFALEFINPEYKTGLDFSMESLKLANQCLGELKAGMKDWPQNDFQQILNMVVLGWGAYIGETVRRCDPAWKDARFQDSMGGGAAPAPADVPFKVKVSIPDLRIRKGPGTNTTATRKFTGIGAFTIMEVKNGPGSTKGWGRLKSGAGWIALDFAQKI